jgi:cytochrome c5
MCVLPSGSILYAGPANWARKYPSELRIARCATATFCLAMGGFLLFAGTTAMTSVALDGEKLAQKRCTQCHEFGRVEKAMAEKDQAAWKAAVDRMIGKREGLLNAEERLAVLGYLAKK